MNRLIEVAFPIREISAESVRDKSLCITRELVLQDSLRHHPPHGQLGFGNVTLWVQGVEQDKLTASIENVPEVTLLQVWNKY